MSTGTIAYNANQTRRTLLLLGQYIPLPRPFESMLILLVPVTFVQASFCVIDSPRVVPVYVKLSYTVVYRVDVV